MRKYYRVKQVHCKVSLLSFYLKTASTKAITIKMQNKMIINNILDLKLND